MNYQEARETLLRGRGRNTSRRKLENNTYLERRDIDTIALRLHDTDIITFIADGRIEVRNGGYPTVTTHDRLNKYLPRPYRVHGEPVETRRSGAGATVLRDDKDQEVLVDNHAEISAGGELSGGDVAEYRQHRNDERNAANRVRNRARYWIRKARGIFTDRSQCTAKGRWNCETRRRFRTVTGLGTFSCGCRTYAKPATYKGTVESVMQEGNVTVRLAMMTCYGIENFFIDANATVIDVHDDYQLVEIRFGNNWERVRALKMVCPSTKAVYINSVPPTTSTVPAALDWMFNTTDYLGTISQAA